MNDLFITSDNKCIIACPVPSAPPDARERKSRRSGNEVINRLAVTDQEFLNGGIRNWQEAYAKWQADSSNVAAASAFKYWVAWCFSFARTMK